MTRSVMNHSPIQGALAMCFVACASACGATVAPMDGGRNGAAPDASSLDTDVRTQRDGEATVVPIVGPTSEVVFFRIRTGVWAGYATFYAMLFAEDAEGRVVRVDRIGECVVRTILRTEYVSVGPLDVFVRDQRSSVPPIAESGGYIYSWRGAEQPSENDVVRVESASGVSFPRLALSARFPAQLTVRAPRGLPERMPFSASAPMAFEWDPPGDASLTVHIALEGNVAVSCFVPAAAGRFDVPQQVLDLFRVQRPGAGRVSLARVNHVQVGNRLIRYQLEESAYNFGFE